LEPDYFVLDMSFEGAESYFTSIKNLVEGVLRNFVQLSKGQFPELTKIWERKVEAKFPLDDLSDRVTEFCELARRGVVLMIDEVDRATDFGVFSAFLGMLRKKYLSRSSKGTLTFHSVILAGVHDIKNLRARIRPDSEHSYNSPWNIAANFDIDMSFSPPEIATMLDEYEGDHSTGMNISAVAEQIYYYTSDYPFLVSRLCKTIDETPLEWSPHGVDDAETRLLGEDNTLFDDLIKNVLNNGPLRVLLEYIVELKIWHGEAYEEKGCEQLVDYLDSQEQKKGWLVSFAGNKKSPRASGTFEYRGFEIAETVIAYRDREKDAMTMTM
jgi:hypothetical protein